METKGVTLVSCFKSNRREVEWVPADWRKEGLNRLSL